MAKAYNAQPWYNFRKEYGIDVRLLQMDSNYWTVTIGHWNTEPYTFAWPRRDHDPQFDHSTANYEIEAVFWVLENHGNDKQLREALAGTLRMAIEAINKR